MQNGHCPHLPSYIGAKLFYLGFRMQPLRIRRAMSLIMSVGLKWTERHDDILIRVMKGEHIDIAIDFTTETDPARSHP